MNLERLGWARTATIALVMAVCFLAAGFAMAWLDRVLSRPGTKPA